MLSDQQIDRYARHFVLKEIGGSGQRRLLDSHVLVVGAGGIGSPILQYLAGAGIGRVTVADDDIVDVSNLHRQTLYGSGDIGRKKVLAAGDRVRQLNSDVTYVPVDGHIDMENVDDVLAGVDVVVDGSDNLATRLIVADAALRHRVPLVSASAGQLDGQLAVYRGWEPDQPCYRCFVREPRAQSNESCSASGVLGSLVGTMGALATTEVIRQITPFGTDTAGILVMIDGLNFGFRKVRLAKRTECACSASDMVAKPETAL
jgi:molybdopterin-synthase adenylyltransferase